MARRQSLRKPEDRAERNLRLVPPPKPKRRPKRRFKLGKVIGKLPYKRNWRLHEHEDAFVLALIRERGEGSVAGWCQTEPGRWDALYLAHCFKRLRRRGMLRGTGWTPFTGSTYKIREDK